MAVSTAALSKEELEQRSFMTKVFAWMTFALGITGLTAYLTYQNPIMIKAIAGNPFLFWGIIIGEFLLVVMLAYLIKKINSTLAIFLFLLYSVLNGLTFSMIFLIYTHESIASTFFITAGIFGAMSIYGLFTKTDLTGIGSIAFMGLIGLIAASVINYFFFNKILYWITTIVGVFIFVGLTAYDAQRIKNLNIIGNEGTEEDKKEAIMGALTLYLDFINLFLMLLRITGRRK